MIPANIDYNYFYKFKRHYKRLGFNYIETPWVVSNLALDITRPLNSQDDSNFVASGEQSFLQLILDGKLPKGKWQTFTPCYRPYDSIDDGLHYTQFYKLELIVTDFSVELENLIQSVIDKLKKYDLNCRIVQTKDDIRSCESKCSYDIEVETNQGFIEFGSYGIRKYKDIDWIYGTGLALPRFQYILEHKLCTSNVALF